MDQTARPSVVEWITERAGKFGTAYTIARIRRTVEPFIRALEHKGFGQAELEYLVTNNISFYRNVMPEPWKRELLKAVRANPQAITSIQDNLDDMVIIAMEVIAEIAPWVPEVITKKRKGWLHNELQEILKDV